VKLAFGPEREVRVSTRQRLIADTLFAVQMVLGVSFATMRVIAVREGLEGVLMGEFILIQVFALLGLYLTLASCRLQKNRIVTQSIIVYSFWTVALGVLIGATLTSPAGTYVWSAADTTTVGVGALAALVVIVVGRVHGLSMRDPMVRGWIALVLKGWPQLMLAVKIALEGHGKLRLFTMILGHATILIRLGQIFLSVKATGWDRPRRGLWLSELGNELTWCVTTIAWILFW
jgi:hypothetical protein